MNIKDNENDSLGATLVQFKQTENIAAGILRHAFKIEDSGAVVTDSAALAGLALNWLPISEENLKMELGDKVGITDGKTVLLTPKGLITGSIHATRSTDSVAMAHGALRAAQGMEQDDGPLLFVGLDTMELLLGSLLKQQYGQKWREMLGYEHDKLDQFGIIQAKEVLDSNNPGQEIYTGSWGGNVNKAIDEFLSAKCPPQGTFNIQAAKFFDEDYKNSTVAVKTLRQVAEYINQMGKPDLGPSGDGLFKEKLEYINAIFKDQDVDVVDNNIAINIASGVQFVNADTLLDYHRGSENNEAANAAKTSQKIAKNLKP